MRKHVLRAMDLQDDKELPGSHVEGTPFAKSAPVRFVWEKTSKQSVHNTRMKTRILESIKADRALYKHVPEKDFSKKTLDAAFEAAYTTLRQKFRNQKGGEHAQNQKLRENRKAQKSRRVSRKKLVGSSHDDVSIGHL
jgi:hypothetical protein